MHDEDEELNEGFRMGADDDEDEPFDLPDEEIPGLDGEEEKEEDPDDKYH